MLGCEPVTSIIASVFCQLGHLSGYQIDFENLRIASNDPFGVNEFIPKGGPRRVICHERLDPAEIASVTVHNEEGLLLFCRSKPNKRDSGTDGCP